MKRIIAHLLKEAMMKKRSLTVIMSMIMAGTLLAGCGSSSSSSSSGASTTSGETTAAAAETTATTAAATESSSDGEKISLTVPTLVGYGQEQIDTANAKDGGPAYDDNYYIAVAASIAKDYPEYDVNYADWGWAESLDAKQRSLFAAGNAPDVVAGETFIPSYANEGLLEPLPQDIIDSVNPTYLCYDPDGNPVAVAYKTSIFMLFYNKDLLSKAGLDPDTPPTTWDEFKEMSDKITAAGNGEFYGGGIPSFPHAGGALRATPFFRMNGTDFAVDGKQNLTDPKLQEVLQFIRDMNANFPEGLGNGTDESPLWDAFKKGQFAFAINGTWQEAESTNAGMNWGVAPLPTKDGSTKGNCTVGTVYLAVPKDAQHKDASFNIIRECLKQENEELWLKGSYAPALNSILDDESKYADDVALKAEVSELKAGTYSGLATFSKNDSSIWEIVDQQVLQRTTMTNDDIATICSDAASQISSLE